MCYVNLSSITTTLHLGSNVDKINEFIKILFFIIIISGVGLSPLGTAATSGLLYKPQMINKGDCGAIDGIKIGRGNRSTRRKPAPAPVHYKSHMTRPGLKPEPPRWEASD
jgi:hypothetical protein